MVDPHQISLYTVAHDWWGVAAFAYGLYKILNYLKSFKESADATKAGVADLKVDLKQQTEAVVGALSTGMAELRQMVFTLSQGHTIVAPRPIRAKRTTVTTTKQIQVDKQPSL
jgi:hypothetical protein